MGVKVQVVDIKPGAALHINQFPEDLHPLLKEIDGPEGNGYLEADELTEVFSMYCQMKKAHKDGSISIAALPKELQPTLKVFDVDGDGCVAPLELARAAELYKDSKNQVRRLVKAVAVLLTVLLLLVGTIVGLVAVVVEESKESEVSGSGVSFLKDSSTPVSTAAVRTETTVFDATRFTSAQLENVKYLKFDNAEYGIVQYNILGVHKNVAGNVVKFYGPNGATITVTPTALQVKDVMNEITFTETSDQTAARRKLLAAHDHATLSMPTVATLNYSMLNYSTADFPPFDGMYPWEMGPDSDSDSDSGMYPDGTMPYGDSDSGMDPGMYPNGTMPAYGDSNSGMDPGMYPDGTMPAYGDSNSGMDPGMYPNGTMPAYGDSNSGMDPGMYPNGTMPAYGDSNSGIDPGMYPNGTMPYMPDMNNNGTDGTSIPIVPGV